MRTLKPAIALTLLLAPLLCAQPTFQGETPNRNFVAAPNQQHTAIFSEPMAGASAATYRFHGSMTGRRAGTYGGAGTDKLTFNASNGFFPGEWIDVTATTGLQSTSSQALAAPRTWRTRTVSGPGPAIFTQKTQALTTTQPEATAIKLADVDGDGDLDCIVCIRYAQCVVYLNDGAGNFTVGSTFGVSTRDHTCMAVADLDGDGDIDVVLGASGQNYVVLNDGSGNFTVTRNFGPGWETTLCVDVGDFNGDGHIDIAAGNYNMAGAGRSSIFVNDGAGNFGTSVIFGAAGEPTRCLALGDMDDDGHLDVVIGNDGAQDYIYFNNGAGGFTSTPTAWGGPTTPTRSLAVGNTHMIYRNLHVIAGYNLLPPELFYNTGGGTLVAGGVTFGSGTPSTRAVLMADFDGDYNLDVAFANNQSQCYVQINDLSSGFGSGTSNFGPGNENASALAAGDIDGDGDIDIVYANLGGTDCRVCFNGQSTPRVRVTAAGGKQLGHNDALPVAYNSTLAAAGLSISIDDPNNYATSVIASITAVTSQGFLTSEFSSASAAVPYVLSPTTGVFSVRGISHTVTLEATSAAGTTTHVFRLVVAGNQDPVIGVSVGGQPLAQGAIVNVAHNSTLAALTVAISVTDPEGDDVAVSAGISQTTTQGFVLTEWGSPSQGTPLLLSPSTGVFNVASASHLISLSATDGYSGTGVFSFRINVSATINSPPNLSVTSNGNPVSSGATLTVAYGSTLAALNLSIQVSDPDNDNTSLAGTVGNVTTQGILNAEFSSASAATPYTVTPTSGTFNEPAGRTHLVELAASDGGGGALFSFTISAQPAPLTPLLEVREGSAVGPVIAHNSAASGGRAFGAQDIGAGATPAITIVVRNAGQGTLNVGTPALGGTHSSSFVLDTTGFPASLTAGADAGFTVAFDPATTGAKSAVVNFTHDDTTQASPFVIHLSGTGTSSTGVLIATVGPIPDGRIGDSYGPFSFVATGGTPGYTWSLLNGAPPPGITLNSAGELSGTPQGPAGVYTFTVRVTDSTGGTDDGQFTLTLLARKSSKKGSGDGGCAAGTSAGLALAPLLLLLLRRRRK